MAERRDDERAVRIVAVREGYDLWSEIYDTDGNPLLPLEEQHLPGLIGNVQGLDVADVGCGTGRHAIPLAAAGARVTALDFSPRMLAVARAKPGAARVRFLEHDLNVALPLADGSFDRVLCCLVAEHVADVGSFFLELARICRRPAGTVILSVAHPALLLRGVEARFRDPRTGSRTQIETWRYQISDYVMAAVRAGLAIEHVSEHTVDEALARSHPRAEKYLGWPLLLLLTARPV